MIDSIIWALIAAPFTIAAGLQIGVARGRSAAQHREIARLRAQLLERDRLIAALELHERHAKQHFDDVVNVNIALVRDLDPAAGRVLGERIAALRAQGLLARMAKP